MSTICRFCTQTLRVSCVYKAENQARKFSISQAVGNSGRFKKMKQQSPDFFQRKRKPEEETSNFLFSREYLDRSIDKLISSEGSRYRFLKKRSCELQEEEEGIRQNVAKDWNHISETVKVLGVPEFADVIGGQMFAGGHLRQTTTCCLTMRLADNLILLSDEELQSCIQDISDWPEDVDSSEVLTTVFQQIDKISGERCVGWRVSEALNFSLIWSRGPFRPKDTSQKRFPGRAISSILPSLLTFSLEETLQFLLLCSYESRLASEITLGEEQKQFIETTLTQGFNKISESEVALAYSALSNILRHKAPELKQRIESTYGFRL